MGLEPEFVLDGVGPPVTSPPIFVLDGVGVVPVDNEGAEARLVPGSFIFTNQTAPIEVDQIGTGTPVMNSQDVFRPSGTGASINVGS